MAFISLNDALEEASNLILHHIPPFDHGQALTLFKWKNKSSRGSEFQRRSRW